MVQWIQVLLILVIVVLLLEARINIGTRIAVIERDIAWLIASLRKWGLVAPGNEKEPLQPR